MKDDPLNVYARRTHPGTGMGAVVIVSGIRKAYHELQQRLADRSVNPKDRPAQVRVAVNTIMEYAGESWSEHMSRLVDDIRARHDTDTYTGMITSIIEILASLEDGRITKRQARTDIEKIIVTSDLDSDNVARERMYKQVGRLSLGETGQATIPTTAPRLTGGDSDDDEPNDGMQVDSADSSEERLDGSVDEEEEEEEEESEDSPRTKRKPFWTRPWTLPEKTDRDMFRKWINRKRVGALTNTLMELVYVVRQRDFGWPEIWDKVDGVRTASMRVVYDSMWRRFAHLLPPTYRRVNRRRLTVSDVVRLVRTIRRIRARNTATTKKHAGFLTRVIRVALSRDDLPTWGPDILEAVTYLVTSGYVDESAHRIAKEHMNAMSGENVSEVDAQAIFERWMQTVRIIGERLMESRTAIDRILTEEVDNVEETVRRLMDQVPVVTPRAIYDVEETHLQGMSERLRDVVGQAIHGVDNPMLEGDEVFDALQKYANMALDTFRDKHLRRTWMRLVSERRGGGGGGIDVHMEEQPAVEEDDHQPHTEGTPREIDAYYTMSSDAPQSSKCIPCLDMNWHIDGIRKSISPKYTQQVREMDTRLALMELRILQGYLPTLTGKCPAEVVKDMSAFIGVILHRYNSILSFKGRESDPESDWVRRLAKRYQLVGSALS